jgi:hypothetical protein
MQTFVVEEDRDSKPRILIHFCIVLVNRHLARATLFAGRDIPKPSFKLTAARSGRKAPLSSTNIEPGSCLEFGFCQVLAVGRLSLLGHAESVRQALFEEGQDYGRRNILARCTKANDKTNAN